MSTKDQIKAALEPFLKKEARETGSMADVYRGREILNLLPKLIAEYEAYGLAIEAMKVYTPYMTIADDNFRACDTQWRSRRDAILTALDEALRAI